MDQIKIGRFIAQKRKEQHLTQMQLAEKLGITDRAVSKWETGKSIPDADLAQDPADRSGICRFPCRCLIRGEDRTGCRIL